MEFSGSFVIRVYAIIINENNEVLITDEFQMNQQMTKFPGGGLIFGEGTIDCLIREIKEECNGQKIKNIRHFHTTDFYQKALFFENKQLISIYYTALMEKPVRFKISEKPFDFDPGKNDFQSFRWVKIGVLDENELSFPIDRFVFRKLKLSYK
jgi:ADP-ribose pyrophosphatase YjhB (NUDIX family)